MRELRDRVWIERYKKYMPVAMIHFEPISGKIDYIEVVATGGDWAKFYPEEFILEQSTGLKDKNGKEIYEGDVVDYNDDGECIGVVKYDAPEFYLDANATDWARMFLKGAPHQKVIGNIHENPELCGEEEG